MGSGCLVRGFSCLTELQEEVPGQQSHRYVTCVFRPRLLEVGFKGEGSGVSQLGPTVATVFVGPQATDLQASIPLTVQRGEGLPAAAPGTGREPSGSAGSRPLEPLASGWAASVFFVNLLEEEVTRSRSPRTGCHIGASQATPTPQSHFLGETGSPCQALCEMSTSCH